MKDRYYETGCDGMSQATNETWYLTWERYISRRHGYVDTDTKPSKIKGSDNSKRKIIITNDGKVTKAKYFDNEKLVCTGVATCHENDVFDVFKGAELALERCRQAKKMVIDKYCYKTATSNIENFMDGDLAVECQLSQVVEFLDWCKGRGIDTSRERNSKTYELFMKYKYIIFHIQDEEDEDRLVWVGYNKPGDSGIRYMTYTKRVMSFDDFFKLPEGVSIG